MNKQVTGAMGAAALIVLLSSSATVSAAVVTGYDAFKLQFFDQVGAATPITPTNYTFAARIFVDTPLSVAASTLTTPFTGPVSMGTSGTVFLYRQDFASLTDLDSTFQEGDNFSYFLASAELAVTPWAGSLTLPLAAFYANSVPHFLNYSATQAINASASFTFSWDSFVTNPLAPVSNVFLVIRDAGQNIILNQFNPDPTITSFTMAAGALAAGQTYSANLYFSSREPTAGSGDGGRSGLASYDYATNLQIRTLPDTDGDGVPDSLDNCTLVANPTQLDSDHDGYGNACDADLNNSGTVTSADFGLMRSVLGQAAGSSPLAAAADLNGSGTVTSADFGLLRARLGTPPGPSGLACAGTIPCP